MKYEFQLSDQEFSRAWLAEFFRRPGLGLFRVLAGPVFVAVGVQMVRGDELFARGIGVAAILLGVWHVLRPFVLVRAMVGQRRKTGAAESTIRLDVGENGIVVSDGAKETRLGWDAITGAGRGRDYVWFEIRKAARGTIPLRAVDDEQALIETFRSRGKWR